MRENITVRLHNSTKNKEKFYEKRSEREVVVKGSDREDLQTSSNRMGRSDSSRNRTMARRDSSLDLRAKLDRRKDDLKKVVIEVSTSRDRREKFTDKENSRRKRSRTRSRSRSHRRSRRSRSRSRSSSRNHKRRDDRRSERSRSHDRKPLSEHKSSKSDDQSKDKTSRKRVNSEDSPAKKKHEYGDGETTEKPAKKKKKKDAGEEKVKKKKKKKDKDKEKKTKKNKAEVSDKDTTIEDNLNASDPGSRKERIDSGISTSSIMNSREATSQSTKTSDSKTVPRRVSDSPLSGNSMSPSPPPTKTKQDELSFDIISTDVSKENQSDLFNEKDNPEVKSKWESEEPDHKTKYVNGDIDERVVGNNEQVQPRKSHENDEQRSTSETKAEEETRRVREVDDHSRRSSQDRHHSGSSGSNRHRDSSRDRDVRRCQHDRHNYRKDEREERSHRSRDEREVRSRDERQRRPTGERDDRQSRTRDDRDEKPRDGVKDERNHRRESSRDRNNKDRDVRASRDRDTGGRRDYRDRGFKNRSPDNRHRNNKRFDRRDRSRDRRDYRDDVRERPHFRRRARSPAALSPTRRNRTPTRSEDRKVVTPTKCLTPSKCLTPTVSPNRLQERSEDASKSGDEFEKKESSLEKKDGPAAKRSRSREGDDGYRSRHNGDRRYNRYGGRRSPHRGDNRGYRRNDSRYSEGRRYSHDSDRYNRDDNYSRRFSTETRDPERNSWESKVDDFMSRIAGGSNRQSETRDPVHTNLPFDPSRPPPLVGHSGDINGYVDPSLVYPGIPVVGGEAGSVPHTPIGLVPPQMHPELLHHHQAAAAIHADPHLAHMHHAHYHHQTSQVQDSTLESSYSSPLHDAYPYPYPAAQETRSPTPEKKVLTAKEKKIQETMQKEIWQYVSDKLLQDPYFLKRRKKKGAEGEDGESLKEKADKCVARLAQKFDKAGFKDARLWSIVKDNEKGVEGFIDAMKCHLAENFIPLERESKKPKDKLEVELLDSGNFFRYAGEFILRSISGKIRHASSSSLDAVPTNVLQNILQTAASLPNSRSNSRADQVISPTMEQTAAVDPVKASFADMEKFMAVKMVETIKLDLDAAKETAGLYVDTLIVARYNFATLEDAVKNYVPPEPEFEGEPKQTIYGHLLETLREISFDQYPRKLSNSDLDSHQTNIVRITLEYFESDRRSATPTKTSSLRTVGEEEDGFIGPVPSTEEIPVGGNTENQMPQRRYVTVYVAVDTVSVEGRLVPWQISVHIPGLPEEEDPDYECLMVPQVLLDRPKILEELCFTYDDERGNYYHHGTEFGRRKAETEEASLEKFANFLDELRSGCKGAGSNNGLVLVFETGEDLAIIQHLFNTHKHNVFYDAIKGLCCLDHYVRVTRPACPASYTWPFYTYKTSDGGRWISTVTKDGVHHKVEALTKPECIYTITNQLLGAVPTYLNFTKWFCYPVQHPEVSAMTAVREHILELVPLQNYVDRQLFTNRVDIALEGVYAVRSAVDGNRVYSSCSRQVVRRLVALGFTNQVLLKSFQQDPAYEIPSTVFLQDMTEVQKLRVHEQTDHIRNIIKQFYMQRINPQPIHQQYSANNSR